MPTTTPRFKVEPNPGYQTYPQHDTHPWGYFAFLAIEMDGYGNAVVIDPYEGTTLTVFDVFEDEQGEQRRASQVLQLVGLAIEQATTDGVWGPPQDRQ